MVLLLVVGVWQNLQALVVARNQSLNVKDTGLCSNTKIPVIFTSEASHASVVKISDDYGNRN